MYPARVCSSQGFQLYVPTIVLSRQALGHAWDATAVRSRRYPLRRTRRRSSSSFTNATLTTSPLTGLTGTQVPNLPLGPGFRRPLLRYRCRPPADPVACLACCVCCTAGWSWWYVMLPNCERLLTWAHTHTHTHTQHRIHTSYRSAYINKYLYLYICTYIYNNNTLPSILRCLYKIKDRHLSGHVPKNACIYLVSSTEV